MLTTKFDSKTSSMHEVFSTCQKAWEMHSYLLVKAVVFLSLGTNKNQVKNKNTVN